MPETSSWFTQWFWIHLGIGEDLSNLLDLHQFLRGWTSKHPSIPSEHSAGPRLPLLPRNEVDDRSGHKHGAKLLSRGKTELCAAKFSGFARLKAMVLVNCYFFLGNEFTIGMLAGSGRRKDHETSIRNRCNLHPTWKRVWMLSPISWYWPQYHLVALYCIISWGLVPPNHPCS